MMKKYNIFLLCGVLFLTGCFASSAPTPTYYVLNPSHSNSVEQGETPLSIVIERPTIVSGLNTDRIALIKNDGRELDYFAQARWNGQLDKIVQDFMIESFENHYDIVEVGARSRHKKADYMVVTKIRDFQAEYAGDTDVPPTIKVTLVCSILKLPHKESVGRIIKTGERTLEQNSMGDIVSGFESLLQETVQDILLEFSQGK